MWKFILPTMPALPPAWLAAASAIWCKGVGRTYGLFAWYDALRYWHANWWCKLWIAVGAAGPTLVIVLYGFALLPLLLGRQSRQRLTPPLGGGVRPIQRGVTDNHGHARWATDREMRKAFGGGEGVLIGASDRSANPQLWFDDLKSGPLHSQYISGSRGFKSVSAITRLWRYHGPRVVFDPKPEIGPVMTPALEAAGYTVKTIGVGESTFNALDWIDIRHPEADVHINTAVEHLYDERAANQANPQQADNPFWGQWGRSIVACLMAHMLYEPSRYPKTPGVLRAGIAMPQSQLLEKLKEIYTTSHSRMACELAGGVIENAAPETWTGIYSNAFNATKWLSTQSYARMVSGFGMKTSDILNDNMVIFVQLPLRSLDATPAIGRVVMGSLFNALYQADGNLPCNRILFEIDEAWVLGRLSEIKLAHATAGGFGGIVQTLWQSEGQIDAVWGKDNAKMLRDTCSWRAYGPMRDPDVAEGLSKAIGEYSVMAVSEGSNKGRQFGGAAWGSSSRGDNISMHEIKRRLIKADEITRSHPEQLFVLFHGFPYPIRCYAAPYFRYPDIAAQMSENRLLMQAVE